jgi:exopolysaccharide production protein ExoY
MKEHLKSLSGLLVIADLLCITAAYQLALVVYAQLAGISLAGPFSGPKIGRLDISSDDAIILLCVGLLTWLASAYFRASYRSHRAERALSTLSDHFKTVIVWMLATGFIIFAFKLRTVSRLFASDFFLFSIVLLFSRQIAILGWIRYMRRKGYGKRDVLLIGDREQAERFARVLAAEQLTEYHIRHVEELAHGCDKNIEADEVFILAGGSRTRLLEPEIIRLLKQGKKVHIATGIFEAALFRQRIDQVGGIPVLTLGGPGLDPLRAVAKRAIDFMVAIVAFLVVSPVMFIVAVLVKLSSRGPVLFGQTRVGKGGEEFRLYKFRSMRSDAEKILKENPDLYQKYVANNFKLPADEDPRITPIGRFLRSTSLDELPQLFNILTGEMSLVGPRPIVLGELVKYSDYAPLYMSVKPGLTGKWQISGRSEVKDYTTRAEMDVEYIRDQSISNDLNIIVRTVGVVLKRKGAY